MPRVNHVKKARKAQGSCGRCGKAIEAGSAYKFIEFRYGGRHVRCDDPKCYFRPSEMTQAKVSAAYAAQEEAQDAIAQWDGEDASDLKTILSDCAEAVRECAQEYRDSADSINDTAQGSSVAEECEQKADDLESWADEMEGVDFEDFEDADEEPDLDSPEHAKWQEKRDEWMEEQRSAADDAVGNCPV